MLLVLNVHLLKLSFCFGLGKGVFFLMRTNWRLKQVINNPGADKISVWTDGSFHHLYGVGAYALLVQCWKKDSVKLHECYLSCSIQRCSSSIEAEVKGVAAAIDLVLRFVKRRSGIKDVYIYTDSREGLQHLVSELGSIIKELPVTTVVSWKKVKSREDSENRVVDFLARKKMRMNLPLEARIPQRNTLEKRRAKIRSRSKSAEKFDVCGGASSPKPPLWFHE
jgi:ribonuclease HI